jgi:hypothetical protein
LRPRKANHDHRLPLLALGAAFVLSACNDDGHTIVQQGPTDTMANQLANAAPVELPPSIVASKTYRCDGNKVVEIDWTERDGKPAGANYRVGADTVASTVTTAPAEGTGPYTGPMAAASPAPRTRPASRSPSPARAPSPAAPKPSSRNPGPSRASSRTFRGWP